MENIDKQEVKKFADLAKEWWNEKIFKYNQKQVYTSSVYDYGKGQRLQIIFEKEK